MDLIRRKSNRLVNYDYSSNGAYFITICVDKRQNILWNPPFNYNDNKFENKLSEYGLIIKNEIDMINNIYSNCVNIDKYVIMPNHIHLIITLQNDFATLNGRPKVAPTISRIINHFKGSVTKQVGFSIWQKSYHDHIIRNEIDYQKIWEYIDFNPLNWKKDCFYM